MTPWGTLGDGEFGGPFAVVPLVLRQDTGLGDVQVLPVQLLHRFQFHDPPAAEVGGGDVLGQLGVGPGGGAEGGLDLLREDGQGLVPGAPHQLGHAENTALGLVFGECPVHQLGEGHGPHDVAHGNTSLDSIHNFGHRFCSASPKRRNPPPRCARHPLSKGGFRPTDAFR